MNKKFIIPLECIILSIMFILVIVGWYLYAYQYNVYSKYIVEDGPIEWLTVIVLVISASICLWRYINLKKQRPLIFCICLLGATCIFLFAAGEEISWGQRIFNYSIPQFFQKYNAQKETNIHNLFIPKSNKEKIKINKLIFGLTLSIIVIIYLTVFPAAYHKYPRVKKLLDSFAVPIPRPVHILSYLILFLLIFGGFPKKGRQGELLELGGITIFMCILIYPQNREIYVLKHQ